MEPMNTWCYDLCRKLVLEDPPFFPIRTEEEVLEQIAFVVKDQANAYECLDKVHQKTEE